MFRDQQEELERLQQELLESETPEEEPEEEADEELLNEETLDELLQDTRAQEAGVYQNYSNDYGKQLRNFATGYKAYNTDKTEVDPQELAEQLEQPERSNTGLLVILLLLSLGLVAMACYLLIRFRGLL